MDKRTPLYQEHVEAGATMIPFGGWEMPVYYTSVIDEHTTTRSAAGMFDTCHMGEFEVTGAGAWDFLQAVITNDMNRLAPGGILYSALTNEKGGCVDDITVYMKDREHFMLCVNAGTTAKDFAWLSGRIEGFDAKLVDVSPETGMIALQGPAALTILKKVCGAEPPSRFNFIEAEVAGIPAMMSRTGYTGEDGVELYPRADKVVELWRSLIAAGADSGLKPCGLGARDTLRLEACYSLYGHELSDEISPVEAGIGFAVSKTKSFPGSDVIQPQFGGNAPRKIAAFRLTERGVPRDGYKVFSDESEIGVVTSGCYSPTFKEGLGLALIKTSSAFPGTEIQIEIRNKLYAGIIVKPPFYQFGGGR